MEHTGKYVVAEGGSIMLPRGKGLLKPGDEVKPEHLNEKQLGEKIRTGYVVTQHRTSPRLDPEAFVENPPGKVDNPPVNLTGKTKEERPITVADRAPVPRLPRVSLWDLDPDGIRGSSLDSLTVMVSERARTVDPFETTEEAIAQLSQDYVAPVLAE